MTSRALRVLLVTGDLVNESSGPYATVRDTAAALDRLGHAALVLGSRPPGRAAPVSAGAGVQRRALLRVGPTNLHFTPALHRVLAREPRPDVLAVQSVWQWNNGQAAAWARRRGIPFTVTVHGNLNGAALAYSGWKKRIVRAWFADAMLAGAGCVHASNAAEHDVVRAFGVTGPVCVIPNGVELPAADAIPRPLREDGAPRTLLYLGRLHPIKGLTELLAAWARLGEVRNGWRLVLAGPDDGGHRATLEGLVRRHGLESHVSFPGPLHGEAKAAAFRDADAFVLPSRSEGFAMAPLEAMAMARPVLLTHACGFPEVAEAGAGVVVDSSPDGLVAGLERVLAAAPDYLARMGRRGRVLVEQRYAWPSVARDLVDVYEWLLGERDPPRTVRFAD